MPRRAFYAYSIGIYLFINIGFGIKNVNELRISVSQRLGRPDIQFANYKDSKSVQT